MATETIRNYSVSDAKMMSEGRSIIDLYKDYHTHFASFDPDTFHENFHAESNQKMQSAEQIPSDMVLIDIQAQKTQAVEKVMVPLLEEIRFAKYFVDKAFPDEPKVVDQFGYNDLQDARHSSNKMIQFMDDFCGQVEKHKQILIDAKYPEEKMDLCKTYAEQLRSKRRAQRKNMKERPVHTAKRIKQLNSVWEELKKIHNASTIIFNSEPEIQALFKLPVPDSKPGANSDASDSQQDIVAE